MHILTFNYMYIHRATRLQIFAKLHYVVAWDQHRFPEYVYRLCFHTMWCRHVALH